jgi:hypothetical protein
VSIFDSIKGGFTYEALTGREKPESIIEREKKIKRETRKDTFNRPHVEDVNQYMSLDEIKDYLIDDDELTNEERFDLYYSEHQREQRKKERRRLRRGAKPMDDIMKELGLRYSDGSQTLNKKKKYTVTIKLL